MRVARVQSRNPQALTNMGVTLTAMGRFDGRCTVMTRRLRSARACLDANWNQALIRLAREFHRRLATIRVSLDPQRRRSLSAGNPALQNLALANGKRVLVWAEQGLGDTLQFSRYLAPLTARGASVTFEVPESLRGLLGRMPHGAQVARDRAAGRFDWQLPLLSLPGCSPHSRPQFHRSRLVYPHPPIVSPSGAPGLVRRRPSHASVLLCAVTRAIATILRGRCPLRSYRHSQKLVRST